MTLSPEYIQELDEKIDIIFDKDNIKQNGGVEIDETSGKVNYDAGELLLQLLSTTVLEGEAKEYVLQKMFIRTANNQSILFYVSIHFGILEMFLTGIQGTVLNKEFLDLLFYGFDYFISLLSDIEIKKLLDSLVSNYAGQYNTTTKTFILDKIKEHRFSSLKQTLSGINIEINKDKEELKNIINYLGFDNKYNKFLTSLDKYFNSDKDSIEIAGLIGDFREFSNNIILDIASTASQKRGLSIIPKTQGKTTPIGNARAYLKVVFELSDHEDNFLDDFVAILNDEGGHAFLSTIEYFRLTKNIFIEIMLLLLSKLRDLKSNI